MLRVYCDTGAYDRRLKPLKDSGAIAVHQFKYENSSRRISSGAFPSDFRYSDKPAYRSYDEMRTDEFLREITYDDLRAAKSLFVEILTIIGTENRTDAQHLDSAQMTGCQVFLTSDKKDIWSKRSSLESVVNMRIFHTSSEWEQFIALVPQ